MAFDYRTFDDYLTREKEEPSDTTPLNYTEEEGRMRGLLSRRRSQRSGGVGLAVKKTIDPPRAHHPKE